jgi:hypothetical protein
MKKDHRGFKEEIKCLESHNVRERNVCPDGGVAVLLASKKFWQNAKRDSIHNIVRGFTNASTPCYSLI